jgi:serine/threonine protein kinase
MQAYEVQGILGEGSFSTVHIGIRKCDRAYVALKFIDPKAVKFGRKTVELELHQELNHENIARLLAFFLPEPRRGEIVLVLDLADMDLKRLIRARRSTPHFFRTSKGCTSREVCWAA